MSQAVHTSHEASHMSQAVHTSTGADRAESHGVVLLLTGGTLLRIALTGEFRRYVKPGLHVYLLLAGAIMVAVALVTLSGALRRRHADHGHGHTHDHGGFDVAWLLAVPMGVLLLVGPPAIGAFAAARSGTALTAAPTSAYPPIPAGDPVPMSVIDFASRAVFDRTHSLAGHTVALTGFLTGAPGGGWYLTRMVVTCCAADAQPVKVGLIGAIPAGAGSNTWIVATGRVSSRTAIDPVDGAKIPFLTIATAVTTGVPSEPYES
jgi:uncharacterized repeat protein (TIGR03943 family)